MFAGKLEEILKTEVTEVGQVADATGLKFYEVVNVINVLTYTSRIYEYDGVDGVAIYGIAK